MLSPLEQFQVNIIFKLQANNSYFDIMFTNVFWCGVLILFAIFFFVLLPLRFSFLLSKAIHYVLELIYKFLVNLFSTINNSVSIMYFPMISTLFTFILLSNLIGLLPYSFTITSQLFVTFACAISTFIGITIIGMWINKFNFIKFFIPSSVTNKPLRYFLVFIEVLSYIIRPFSLGIRLFANMLAGHTLIYILANFSYSIAIKFFFFTIIIPFFVIFLIMILEFCIAFIQTYVFTILTIIYFKDMYNISH